MQEVIDIRIRCNYRMWNPSWERNGTRTAFIQSGDVGLCWGVFGYDCIFENPCFEMLYTRSCMNSMVFMGDLIFFTLFMNVGLVLVT